MVGSKGRIQYNVVKKETIDDEVLSKDSYRRRNSLTSNLPLEEVEEEFLAAVAHFVLVLGRDSLRCGDVHGAGNSSRDLQSVSFVQ